MSHPLAFNACWQIVAHMIVQKCFSFQDANGLKYYFVKQIGQGVLMIRRGFFCILMVGFRSLYQVQQELMVRGF